MRDDISLIYALTEGQEVLQFWIYERVGQEYVLSTHIYSMRECEELGEPKEPDLYK